MPGSQECGDGNSRIRRALLADPRRNTSKSFFEAGGSGNKAATCCRFVSALVAACCQFVSSSIPKVETKWQHLAASALIN
jgi:hypothetical protein